MKDFFENYPLYKTFKLLEDYGPNNEYFVFKSHFNGESFDDYCEIEKSVRPFEISIYEEVKPIKHSPELKEYDAIIPESHFVNEKLDFLFIAPAICQSCKQYRIDFFLRVFSDQPISPIYNNFRNVQLDPRHKYNFPNTSIFTQKVGCWPEKKIQIDKSIGKHFDRETNNWLYKAKESIASNFGIGAFAYSRRIVEKELINIINEIKELPDANSLAINKLLEDYESNPKTSTIYDNIMQYLPSSLRQLPDNPIALLYKQTSSGLHSLSEDSLSEEQCLEKAESIIELLEFTIKKINEEKSDIKSVKDAIKRLK